MVGTNYYYIEDVCPHCGRGGEPRHIGKDSFGWCFALHVYPEEGIPGLEDWKRLWSISGTKIEDEYGRQVSPEEMEKTITEKTWPKSFENRDWFGYDNEEAFHRSNHSVRGPNNLLRSKIDGQHCIGHEQSWDLFVGDFS